MAPNDLAKVLAATAERHMRSYSPQTPGSNDFDPNAILAHLDPDFQHDWGHKFFISGAPPLQRKLTGQGFVDHMQSMAPRLETWKIDITEMNVDVEKRTVVLRADFHMKAPEADEVLNDIVFWLAMDESGEKLRRCTEFIDPVASKELAARMGKPT